jgi:hypothetical protein
MLMAYQIDKEIGLSSLYLSASYKKKPISASSMSHYINFWREKVLEKERE